MKYRYRVRVGGRAEIPEEFVIECDAIRVQDRFLFFERHVPSPGTVVQEEDDPAHGRIIHVPNEIVGVISSETLLRVERIAVNLNETEGGHDA